MEELKLAEKIWNNSAGSPKAVLGGDLLVPCASVGLKRIECVSVILTGLRKIMIFIKKIKL